MLAATRGLLGCEHNQTIVVWIVGLSRVPVSQAYPLLSLGYVLNIGLAWWLFGEVPNAQHVIGIAVIIGGVVLVARSTLGTINHTLLSLEAIRRRGLPLAGVVISGPETPHNRAAIERYGQVAVIAEIPWLDIVTPDSLKAIEPELDLAKLAKPLP